MKTVILNHNYLLNVPINPSNIKFGEVAIEYKPNRFRLLSKDVNGQLVEIGKGVDRLEDLEDVDIINPQEGDFIVRFGDKWKNTKYIADIKNLSGVELSNLQQGQTLIWDTLKEAFVNSNFSFRFKDLLDVDFESIREIDNKEIAIVQYDSSRDLFVGTTIPDKLSKLKDVKFTYDLSKDYPNQIFGTSDGLLWRNRNLEIEWDLNPVLGGNLNANFKYIENLLYKFKTLTITQNTHTISYSDGDYWVIEGSNVDCLLLLNIPKTYDSDEKEGSVAVLFLEVTKRSGNILLSGLDNVVYNDGRAIEWSGDGKTDLISITVTENQSIISMLASNLKTPVATIDNPNFIQYDKSRYPTEQVFNLPIIYDSLFRYVELLLFCENTNKYNWDEDSSGKARDVSFVYISNSGIDSFSFGKRNYVASFLDRAFSNINSNNLNIILDGDFTIEFFISYPFLQETNTNVLQKYFESDDIALYYEGMVDYDSDIVTNQLRLIVKTQEYIYPQPIRFYKNSQDYYYHYAIVRKNNTFYLWVDGIKLIEFQSNMGQLLIHNLLIRGFRANFKSLRITKYARYINNFEVPNMRFGLLGGFEGDKLLENIVLNKWYNVCEVEDVVAYMMFGS